MSGLNSFGENEMNEPRFDAEYTIFITEQGGTYDLHIRELLVRVRGRDLPLAYAELIRRKDEIIAWARSGGTLEDVPLPQVPPPVLHVPRLRYAGGGRLSWLRRFWRRLF